MADREKVIKGLECCVNHQKTGFSEIGCSHNGCLMIENGNCVIDIMPEIIALLKAQEPTKFQIKTTISNVDIPKDIDEEQFMVVLSQQYAALAKLYGDELPTYSQS